jgi:peptidoglycan DL-endopeptidase LytF
MPSSPLPKGHTAPRGAFVALIAIVLAASGFSVPASGASAFTTRPRAPAGPVLEIGDSLGIDLGWGLTDELSASRHRLVAVAVGDTGLAEPSYYDWPAQLAVDLRLYHPGTVVVFLGANDVESFYSDDRFFAFGSSGWAALYARRVAKLIDEAVSAGAKVLWVGMPPMDDPSFSSDMAALNAVYRAEALAHRPDVSYYASWRVLGGPQGQYREALAGPDGEQVALRAPDGVHITRAGGDLLGKAVVARLERLGWL